MTPARTSAFYIANLGSEVSRLQSALARGDGELANGAIKRARTIFKKLSQLPLGKPARAEITLLQEVVEDLVSEKPRFLVDTHSLQTYFLPFARLVLNR